VRHLSKSRRGRAEQRLNEAADATRSRKRRRVAVRLAKDLEDEGLDAAQDRPGEAEDAANQPTDVPEELGQPPLLLELLEDGLDEALVLRVVPRLFLEAERAEEAADAADDGVHESVSLAEDGLDDALLVVPWLLPAEHPDDRPQEASDVLA